MEPTQEQIQAMQAAEQARRVLEDPLVAQALDAIEQTIVEQWVALGVENRSQAEELKRLLWAAKQFRSIFEVTIAGGSVAKNELLLQENMEIKAEAAKRRIYGA